MRAIALSAPDGRVYAYACGVCRHVASSGERMVDYDDAIVDEIAESSRRYAEHCCQCNHCGAETKRTQFGDERPFNCCEACWPAVQEAARVAQEEYEAKQRVRDEVREQSLSVALDRNAADALRTLMSDISEDYYCAGWLIGLEHELWRMLAGGDRRFGLAEVREDEVMQLRALSERAGGWWDYDRFYSLDEWMRMAGAKTT